MKKNKSTNRLTISFLDLYLLHHDQLVLVNDYSISQNIYSTIIHFLAQILNILD